MRHLYLLFLLLCLPQYTVAQEASLAWFTDASMSNSIPLQKPADALPEADGTYGKGVSLDRSLGISSTGLQQAHGMISFWIKPSWDGNDGLNHKILHMGNFESNGILIEKSSEGLLRFVMAGQNKVAAARYTVDDWKAGKWHHVAVSWRDDSCLGIALWIDKVCVDSCIYTGDAFMNPETMTDNKVYIGDVSSNAVMDELIFRREMYRSDPWCGSQLELVYRDYFGTAPFTAIKINPNANSVRSDARVVKGQMKQFGLQCLMEGKWIDVTNFEVRWYGNWGHFDAKPFISWSTSNSNIATVDDFYYSFNRGRVTGVNIGQCTLTADFRDMTATYNIDVISPDQPDLDLMFVERLPRYSANAEKIWPSEGETVESVVHVGNFGYRSVSAGTVVKFELISDANGNFLADPDELPFDTRTAIINTSLAPKDETTVTFSWQWTMQPVFVRVTLDPPDATLPNGTLAEVCEANNQRCELNIARAFHWGWVRSQFDNDYDNKHLNLVGSFSDYDWCNAETDRMELVMRDAVWPTTSPVGIKDSIRVDQFTERLYFGNDSMWNEEPWVKEGEYYDGGFPTMEPENSTVMDIDPAIGHEIGHTTIGLPDLYGHPHSINNVYIRDKNGELYAGTKYYPAVNWGEGMFTTGTFHYTDQLGLGYAPLMVSCHLWLHPANAGWSNYHAQKRKGLFDIFGQLIPKENHIKLLDVYDQPLKGAAIYIYQMINTGEDKYLPGWPKFVGNSDDNGIYLFPHQTAPTWDDWTTEQLDGAVYVDNPFSREASKYAWGPSWKVGEYFIMKIVCGDQIEFRPLALTDFNEAFYRGEKDLATYPIRTNLKPVSDWTDIDLPVVPNIRGTVKGIDGKPMAGAVVGIKDYPYASADARCYVTTDQNGNYGPIYMYPGSCYVAAWKEGFSPTADAYVTVAEGQTFIQDLQLTKLAGKNLLSDPQMVNASNSDGDWSAPGYAVDGDQTTAWHTKWGPDNPTYFYIDLGKPTDIDGITIYRFLERNPYGNSADDYTIDIITSGTPLDAESWYTNSTVRNVYSATNTIHGYQVGPNLVADPIGLQLTGVRGIRLMFTNSHWPPIYDIREIILHSTTEYEGVAYGCVRDTSGNPVYNAVVQLGTSESNQTIFTNETGAWQFALSPGTYSLYVDALGYAGRTMNIVVPGGGVPLSKDIIIAAKDEPGQYNGNFELASGTDQNKADGWEIFIDSSFTDMYNIGRDATQNTTPEGVASGTVSVGTKDPSIDWAEAWMKPTATHRVPINPLKTYNFYFKAKKTGWAYGSWQLIWRGSAGNEISRVSGDYWWIPLDDWTQVYQGYVDGFQQPMIRMTPPAGTAWAEVQIGFRAWTGTDQGRGGTTFIDDIVIDEFKDEYSTVPRISNLRTLQDGQCVAVNGKQITALPSLGIPDNTAYLEELDRSSGIRIDLSSLDNWNTQVGKNVNLRGYLMKTPDGERSILASQMSAASDTSPVSPLLMNNRSVGGSTSGDQYGTWEWRWIKNRITNKMEYTFVECQGLNNIGLFVKVYGQVTQIDPGGKYFYVDDGTTADDETYTGNVRNKGIRVACNGTGYTSGSSVVIKGVVSCFKHTDGKLRRLLRPVSIE